MSISLRPGHRIYVFSEYVDLRAGFDRLSMYVRDRMEQKLLEGDLFLFLGNNRRRLKAICFDGTGLILFSKRLESGHFMRLDEFESGELKVEELDILLRGGVIRRSYFGEKALTKLHRESKLKSDEAAGTRDTSRSTS